MDCIWQWKSHSMTIKIVINIHDEWRNPIFKGNAPFLNERAPRSFISTRGKYTLLLIVVRAIKTKTKYQSPFKKSKIFLNMMSQIVILATSTRYIYHSSAHTIIFQDLTMSSNSTIMTEPSQREREKICYFDICILCILITLEV